MRDWSLCKVIWVADRGFTSAENRRYLRKGGGSYIIGEKLRSGSADAQAALSRQGRYKDVAGNLQVKEVRIADDERFVICFNPEAAERDAAVRARMIARLEEAIRGLRPAQPRQARRAARRDLHEARPEPLPARHPGRPAPHRRGEGEGRGEPRREVPAAGPRTRTCPPRTSPLGYKQLLEVERGWRDMKQVIDLRPVYHRREDRIRAHVILCWLALLLARVAENAAGRTWPDPRRELDPHPRRHLHRPRRHLPAAHRAHQSPARHPQSPANRRPATRLPAETPAEA